MAINNSNRIYLSNYPNCTKLVIPNNIKLSNNGDIYRRFASGTSTFNSSSEIPENLKSHGYKIIYNNTTNINTYLVMSSILTSINIGEGVVNQITNAVNVCSECNELITGINLIGINTINMQYAFYNCTKLTGNPVYRPNVINMARAYYNCRNITGNPVCGPNVINMYMAYDYCCNLTGSPVCGPNVINMEYAYSFCFNLTGNPVCGDKINSMYYTYNSCHNLTGSPVCGDNVVNMDSTYHSCYNLTGNPVCGPNVISMSGAYVSCINLTGNPVCGPNVTNMHMTYVNCVNLTGTAACGDNVTNMDYTYQSCKNIIPYVGPNVISLCGTFNNCGRIYTNQITFGNATSAWRTYSNCEIYGYPNNIIVIGNTVINALYCFSCCDFPGIRGITIGKNVQNIAAMLQGTTFDNPVFRLLNILSPSISNIQNLFYSDRYNRGNGYYSYGGEITNIFRWNATTEDPFIISVPNNSKTLNTFLNTNTNYYIPYEYNSFKKLSDTMSYVDTILANKGITLSDYKLGSYNVFLHVV